MIDPYEFANHTNIDNYEALHYETLQDVFAEVSLDDLEILRLFHGLSEQMQEKILALIECLQEV